MSDIEMVAGNHPPTSEWNDAIEACINQCCDLSLRELKR